MELAVPTKTQLPWKVAGGYHGPVPSRYEEAARVWGSVLEAPAARLPRLAIREEEVGSLKWLLKEAEGAAQPSHSVVSSTPCCDQVTWYEYEPAQQRTREAVKKEDVDGGTEMPCPVLSVLFCRREKHGST